MDESLEQSEHNEPSEEDHSRQLVAQYNAEMEERYNRRMAARTLNIQPKRPDEASFSKLDSSLKKNTSFVRKVKNFSAAQLSALMNDLKVLNLSKYITEIASAVTEARLKAADILPACELCCGLHRMYAEFEPALLECWKKALNQRTDDGKFRMDLRLFSESVLCGIFGPRGLQLLSQVLLSLVHEGHVTAGHVLNFCRSFGDEFAGLVPREIVEASGKVNVLVFNQTVMPFEKHKAARTLFSDYYETFCKHLLKCHEDLQKFEKHSRSILQTKGELSSNRKNEHAERLNEYHKLVDTTRQLSEALNLPVPDLPVEAEEKSQETALEEFLQCNEEKTFGIWGDEETQRFYESMPNLHVYVPHLVPAEPTPPVEEPSDVTEEQLDVDLEVEIPDVVEEEKKVQEETPEPEVGDTRSKLMLSDFMIHLPNCCNRDTVDNMAIEFVLNLNTKHNRKKLARGLFAVNRTRLDLLPFFARLVAIVQPVAPDVSVELCQLLKHDFLYHIRKKDQINIETKIKVVRFIGELVKFRLYSKLEALFSIKILLQDFNHHHIEMLCNILETCGRFLYSQEDSHHRTKVYLEQMMRKKAVMSMDSRYVTMVENAFYAVIPREGGGPVAVKDRPPMHQFIRFLLYQELNKQNAQNILKLMQKLDWDNAELSAYIIKCLVNAWNLKYFNIKTLAWLVAELSRYLEEVQIEVVDGVIEDVRLCLENPLPKYNQRRIAMVKYLGELYYYHMVETGDIIKTLYLLISLGVSLDHTAPSPLDPPGHVFRLKLVCVLLETCGQYFSSAATKRKLEYFLVFFQNYYWFKRSDPYWTADNEFPIRIQLMVRDSIVFVRPSMIIFLSADEACEAADELRAHFLEKVGTSAPLAEKAGGGDLNPIEEEEASSDDEEESYSNTQQSQSQGDDFAILPSDSNVRETDPVALKNCPEDDDFMSAFDKLVAEQMQDRKERPVPHVDISVPVHVKASTKKTYEQLSQPETDQSSISFVLMLKRGNKQTYKNLSVPVTSELALNLKQQELVAKMEMEKVKRLTLNNYERLEEEDYQDMMSQTQRPAISNLNRERRQKYQHPKGAPDADLIFGSSKGK